MIKISRKIVVIIALSIMIIGVFGFGGLIKLQQTLSNQIDVSVTDSQNKEAMQSQLDYFKNELKNVEERVKNAENDVEKSKILLEKINIEQNIETFQLAVDTNVNIYSSGYRAVIINEISSIKIQNQFIEATPENQRTPEQIKALSLSKGKISSLLIIIKEKDFKKYIEMKNKEIDDDITLSDDEKKLKKETNQIWLSIDPNGEKSENDQMGIFNGTLGQIENLNRSLLYNIDYSSQGQYVKPLTPDGRNKITNDLAILIYKAEHDMINTSFNSLAQMRDIAVTGMLGFGTFMIVCMMLILAGGAVSQEISTGSIKSLIISPTKRYKIYFAKLLSLVSVVLVSGIVLYIVTIISNGLFFGFDNGSPFIFAVNGVALQLNFYIFRLAYLFIGLLDVVVYMMLAFMLSIITRNTATSVGVSIAIYFGGGLANTFLSIIAKGEWAKFIPFNNLGLASRIFPDPLSNLGMGFNIFGTSPVVPTITFSLIYILVIVYCFGYIAMDSFNRRDIK